MGNGLYYLQFYICVRVSYICDVKVIYSLQDDLTVSRRLKKLLSFLRMSTLLLKEESTLILLPS